MRTLYIFILLAGSLLPAYALNGRGLPQDSVKRVTITVTAAEKPKELDFDSLVKSREARKPVSSPAVAARASRSGAQTPVRSSASRPSSNPKNQQKRAEQPSATPAKASATPQSHKTVVSDSHEEEIASAEATNEKSAQNSANIKASRTYLWIGFMLIVVGAILAILFGKMALLVSLAGIVFVIIGYSI